MRGLLAGRAQRAACRARGPGGRCIGGRGRGRLPAGESSGVSRSPPQRPRRGRDWGRRAAERGCRPKARANK
eukprot:7670206-Pyramimonas_sp.AAC.1